MPFAFLTDGNALFAAFVAAEWVIRIVMLVVVPFRRSPDAAKGWLLLILFEPVLGLSLYLVFGRRRLPAWRLQRAAAFHVDSSQEGGFSHPRHVRSRSRTSKSQCPVPSRRMGR